MTTTVDSASRQMILDPETAETHRAWRVAAATLAVGITALIAIFWEPAAAAVRVWSTSATFNHCFLIIPIVAYLLWERRIVFSQARPAPTFFVPVAAVIIGSAAWLVANTATVYEIQQFALFGMLQCLLLAVLGWRVYFALLFPLLYLVFLVPTGEQIVPALQDFTTWFIMVGLNLIGIPNYVDGVFITVPTGMFHVAEACAGLRFMVASLAYGFLFADLIYGDWKRRVIFIALSLLIPIIANGFRALGIVLIAYYTNHEYAVGADHLVYGWGFFAAVTLLLTWIGLKFRDAPDDWQVPRWARVNAGFAPRTAPAAFVAAGAAVIAAAAWGPAYGAYLDAGPAKAPAKPITIAAPQAPWRQVETGTAWRPVFANPSAESQFRFQLDRERAVDVHVVFYAEQRKGSELISFANDLQTEDWRRLSDGRTALTVDGAPLNASLRRITDGTARRFVWSWYWIDGRFVAQTIPAKLAQVNGKLITGRRAAAAVMLSVEAVDEAAALRTLREFLAASPPIKPQLEAVAASTR
jgi:exosortase A